MIAFVVSVALARLLGPEEFGLVGIAMLYLGLVQIVVSQGFTTAIIQRDVLESEHLDSAFWFGLVAAILFGVATVFTADAIAAWFGEPRAALVLKWLSLLFVLVTVSSVPTAILTRELSFKALSVPALVSVAVGGAVGLTLAFTGWGVWSLVAQQVIGAMVNTGLLWWATPWRPRRAFSMRHLRDLQRVGLSILGNEIVWYFSRRSDQAMVGSHFGAIGLGPYAFASRIVQLIVDLTATPFQSVALPALLQLRDQEARLRNGYRTFVELAAFSSFPLFAGLFILADDFVGLFFGPRWAPAIPLLRVLSCYGALNVAFGFLHPLMVAKGRAGMSFVLTVVHACLTLLACWFALRWGIIAVAVATTSVTIVFPLIFKRVYERTLELRLLDLYTPIAAPTLAIIVMALAVELTQLASSGIPALAKLTLSIAVGAVSYGFCCFFMRPALARELIQLLKSRLLPASTVA